MTTSYADALTTRLLNSGPLTEPTPPPSPSLYALTGGAMTRIAAVDPLWAAHPSDPIEVCHAARLAIEGGVGLDVTQPVATVALYMAGPGGRTLFAATPGGHARLLRQHGDQPPVDCTTDPAAISVVHHPLALLARAWALTHPDRPITPHGAAGIHGYQRLAETITGAPPPSGFNNPAWMRVLASALRLHALAAFRQAGADIEHDRDQ